MALKITTLASERAAAGVTSALVADRRLWLTQDHRVVEDGDPAAAFLLVAGPGDLIAQDVVQRLGLSVNASGSVQLSGAVEPEEAEPSEASEPTPRARTRRGAREDA